MASFLSLEKYAKIMNYNFTKNDDDIIQSYDKLTAKGAAYMRVFIIKIDYMNHVT